VDIEQGAPVKVKQVEGLKLYVEPSAEPATATTPIDS
jgi:hypothetical protein